MTKLFTRARGSRSSKGSVNYKSILGFWWVIVAFAVPCFIRYRMLTSGKYQDHGAVEGAVTCGIIGLSAALGVYGLWQLDRYICVKKGKEPKEIKEKSVKLVVWCLGFFLWIAWLGAGVCIVQVNSEINDRPAAVFSR